MNFFRPKAKNPTAVSQSVRPVPIYCPQDGCPLTEQEQIINQTFDTQTGKGVEKYNKYLLCTHCSWKHYDKGEYFRDIEPKCSTPIEDAKVLVSEAALHVLTRAYEDYAQRRGDLKYEYPRIKAETFAEMSNLAHRYRHRILG